MSALPFDLARALVLEKTIASRLAPETAPLAEAAGRILAEDVRADRDYPPFPRSARDGFAVRAADVAAPPARLCVLGETRAGEPSRFEVGAGEAVEIMTGAPAPAGADAVVMVEYSRREGDDVVLAQSIESGRNIVPQGSEAARGDIVLAKGARLDYPQIALLASVGCVGVPVWRRPQVAILSTGDEVLPIEAAPESFQIRNSNAASLAAQVRRRGGEPLVLPVAPDRLPETRDLIRKGLQADMLLLSGGVSMGKHDLVETALAELGAEILITQVKIQPGKPFVFGLVGDRPVCGLPGNPVSTMVTFELFARPALELLSGVPAPGLPFVEAPLARPFRHKPVLTRFLPAQLIGDSFETRVEPIQWQGSGDLAATARANCFLVAPDSRESWEEGERIAVLPL
ncbi:MAG: molybdopterin molybdotransferase MoeA [Acidobacteria bacterium]|nr:molybdopterin molybdotransferase MoeA [Acidobacteriota bacterium]